MSRSRDMESWAPWLELAKEKKLIFCNVYNVWRTFFNISLREKCPYSELFWSAFFGIRIEYEEILCISPYSVRIRENAEQNNSEYGHFSRSAYVF